jgi:type I restriction enzyme S subunit
VRGVTYTKSDARSEPNTGLIPILRATNIQDGRLILDDFVYVPARYVSQEQFVKPGDLLIATSSGSRDVVGKTAVAGPEHSRFAFGAFCSVARPKTETVPEWIAYFTRSGEYRRYVEEVALGININNFRTKDLEALPLPLAPPSEQNRILAKLDNLFNHSKNARAELSRIPRLVERYRQAIVAAAFRGDLTSDWRSVNDISLDKEWTETTLGDVSIDVRYGTAAKCHYEPKDTPVLRIPNVINGHINTSDLKYGRFNEREIEKLALRIGDLLVIRSNGSLDLVGRAALATDAVAGYLYAGYLIRIRLNSERVDPVFAQLAFEEPFIRRTIEKLAKSTSGVNNINGKQLKALTLPLPQLLEQREIVRRVETAFAHIERTASEAARATDLLDRLDQATLAKAFRGELLETHGGSASGNGSRK